MILLGLSHQKVSRRFHAFRVVVTMTRTTAYNCLQRGSMFRGFFCFRFCTFQRFFQFANPPFQKDIGISMAISCNFALQGLWRHICARRHQLRGSLSFAIQWNSHFCLLPRGFGVVTFQLSFHNLFSQLGLCHFCWTLDYPTILLTGQHGSRPSSNLDAATLWTRRLFGSYADSIRLHQAVGWELELFRWWLGRWVEMEIFWRISEVRLL